LGDGHTGRRTGSAVIWTPPGLLTGIGGDQLPVIVTVAQRRLAAYDAASGARLWSADLPDGACRETAFTAPGALLVADSCTDPRALRRYDLRTGSTTSWDFRGFTGRVTVTALGCRLSNSECGGFRLAQAAYRSTGWLLSSDATPVESMALASSTAWLAGHVAVDSLDDMAGARAFTGKDARGGAILWTWSPAGITDSGPAQLIAATPERILLLTRQRMLIALDPATGREFSRTSVVLPQDPLRPYAVGRVYANGQYAAIERLVPDADPAGTDDEYYYTSRPILLAAS
jgi:hypothetical protein